MDGAPHEHRFGYPACPDAPDRRTAKEQSMTTDPDLLRIAWWAKNLDELDREISKLASLCQVRILDPGVVERVLHNDASVCGTANPVAFAKLHNLLVMHFLIRKRSVEELGAVQTTQIERDVIERLKKAYGQPGEGLATG